MSNRLNSHVLTRNCKIRLSNYVTDKQKSSSLRESINIRSWVLPDDKMVWRRNTVWRLTSKMPRKTSGTNDITQCFLHKDKENNLSTAHHIAMSPSLVAPPQLAKSLLILEKPDRPSKIVSSRQKANETLTSVPETKFLPWVSLGTRPNVASPTATWSPWALVSALSVESWLVNWARSAWSIEFLPLYHLWCLR